MNRLQTRRVFTNSRRDCGRLLLLLLWVVAPRKYTIDLLDGLEINTRM